MTMSKLGGYIFRILGFFSFILLVAVLCLGPMYVENRLDVPQVLHDDILLEKQIAAIQDTGSTEGTFFLASGILSDKLIYRMYLMEENSEDTVKLFELDPNEVDVYITQYDPVSNKVPTLTHHHKYKSKAEALKENDYGIWELFISDTTVGSKYYEIQVPRGTIFNTLNLDLQ